MVQLKITTPISFHRRYFHKAFYVCVCVCQSLNFPSRVFDCSNVNGEDIEKATYLPKFYSKRIFVWKNMYIYVTLTPRDYEAGIDDYQSIASSIIHVEE